MITGAGGQLGRELAARLGPGQLAVDRRGLDISDQNAVQAYCEANKPAAIVNCAAYTAVDRAESEPEAAFAVNERGAINLAVAARNLDIPLIHISTDFVFAGRKSSPYKESDRVAPLGVYGRSKLAGERGVLATWPRSLIIRTGWLYAAHGRNFLNTMLHYARERGQLRVVADQVGTPTYAGDLAAAVVEILVGNLLPDSAGARHYGALAGQGASGQIFHYANEGVASWYDFACAIVELSGIPCRVEPITTREYPTPARRPSYSVLNKEKIKKRFGLSIPHWRDSLRGSLGGG